MIAPFHVVLERHLAGIRQKIKRPDFPHTEENFPPFEFYYQRVKVRVDLEHRVVSEKDCVCAIVPSVTLGPMNIEIGVNEMASIPSIRSVRRLLDYMGGLGIPDAVYVESNTGEVLNVTGSTNSAKRIRAMIDEPDNA